jgi:hypothetical protein
MKMASQSKTAGEVRFIKDKSNDHTQWAWQDAGPQERKIAPDYAFTPRKVKQLAKVLRATTASMGHAMSAYNSFSKLKSADVSPDGSLGGKGYIQKIAEMRRAYMNVVEALSALSDTIYDEVNAPHWAAISRQENDEDREEVEQIVQDAENIKEDPEAWAKEEEEEMDEAHSKKASTKTASDNLLWSIIDERGFHKLRRSLGKQKDEATVDMATKVSHHFMEKLTLNNNERGALNRLRQSVENPNWDISQHRNNIFKAANLLGIKLPHMMFASDEGASKLADRYLAGDNNE